MAIRYRRNINCLTTNQLHDLREAYQALYDLAEDAPESFARIAGLHGLPAPGWCDHWTPGFLTWHRAYMKAFERALQSIHCDVMLPFWDWSSAPTTGVPAACASPTYVNRAGDTVPNPLYRGPIASAAGGGWTSRGAGIATQSFAGPHTSAQTALGSADFASFQNALNGPHGSVHILTGGHMGDADYAGFDPIFYLHHCNVDRLWWNWQQTHPAAAMPLSEQVYEIDPFNRPFSTEWQTGADMVSTDDLGYRYSNWCLWIPPIIIWQVVWLELDPVVVRSLRDARLVLRSAAVPAESVEFRVFLDAPDADHRTDVSAVDGFAGSIGLFGMGSMAQHDGKHTARPGAGRDLDIELNLTGALRRRCAHHDRTSDGTARADHHGHEHEHDAAERDEAAREAAAAGEAGEAGDVAVTKVALKIVAVDAAGEPVDPSRIDLTGIELVID